MRASGLALGELFAHAQDRHEACCALRRREFARHELIGLAIEGAALGMADDDACAAHVLQHRRGHLAGEGALGLRANILRPRLDARAPPARAQLRQVHERRAHRTPRPSTRQLAHDGLDQRAFSAREPCIFQLPAISGDACARFACAGSKKGRDHSGATPQDATRRTTAASSSASARVSASSRPRP